MVVVGEGGGPFLAHAVQCVHHRRRIQTEEKAKVVASVGVKNFFNSLTH